MKWKFSANLGFFGARQDRFNQYQPHRSIDEKFDLAAQIQGVSGVELKFPFDFVSIPQVRTLLDKYDLKLSAVNVDIKDINYFRYGALTARDVVNRRHAIDLLCSGMDIAAEFGIGLVTTCPVMDGFDYPFQLDYSDAWGYFIDSIRTVTSYRRDVTLLLEYQPSDPVAQILLNNIGKVLYMYSEVGAPNLGANLDVGHAFAAGESPSEAACLLTQKGLLHYIHTNDNTGWGGDWDMISGSVHFWHWLEFLYTLIKLNYCGWFSGDIAPRHFSPVDGYQTNMVMIQNMTHILEYVGLNTIASYIDQEGKTGEIFRLFSQSMSGGHYSDTKQNGS